MWASSRSSLVQGQHLAIRCQLNSTSCGGATKKNEKITEVHSIASCFGHEDLVKTKLFTIVFEKKKGIAFYYNLILKYPNFKKS
jgi:hypothetical protein